MLLDLVTWNGKVFFKTISLDCFLLPGINQRRSVGAVVLNLNPVHAHPGIRNWPVSLFAGQMWSFQGLFEKLQFSHGDFTVFWYSTLHVEDKILTSGVRIEHFSRNIYMHLGKAEEMLFFHPSQRTGYILCWIIIPNKIWAGVEFHFSNALSDQGPPPPLYAKKE